MRYFTTKKDMRFKKNREYVKSVEKAKNWLILIAGLIVIGFVVNTTKVLTKKREFLSPIPDEKEYCIPWSTIEKVINETIDEVIEEQKGGSQTPPEAIRGRVWEGIASYYSEAGCVGCSESLTMANGQRLDDNKPTVAFNRLPLGSMVRVINKENMMFADVEVTDTGGFEKLGRIIDLNLKTKKMIGCSDLCQVEILSIKEKE